MESFIQVFKALGDETRLKILKLLTQKTLCVHDLSEILEIKQPRVSQHLKILRDTGIVDTERNGCRIFYSIKKNNLQYMGNRFRKFIDKDLLELINLSDYSEKTRHLLQEKEIIHKELRQD